MKADKRCFCGSRKAHRFCHYDVAQNSKYAHAYREYLHLNKFCKNKGVRNICIENCCQCCNDYFYISENEFLLVLDYIMRKKLDLESYISKANEYRAWFSQAYPSESTKIESLMPSHRGMDSFTRTQAYFNDEAIDHAKPCIFLENGTCNVYDVRPLLCRGYGSLFPCILLDNKDLRSEINLGAISARIQMIGNDGDIINKRPYPMFYWFSEFLSEKYRDTTMIKMKKFKELSEQDYQLFSLRRI